MLFLGFKAWSAEDQLCLYNSPRRRGILASGSWPCFGGQARGEGKEAQRCLASEAFTVSHHSNHSARKSKVSQFEGVHSEPERKIYNKILW